jgi:hypothetical protein
MRMWYQTLIILAQIVSRPYNLSRRWRSFHAFMLVILESSEDLFIKSLKFSIIVPAVGHRHLVRSSGKERYTVIFSKWSCLCNADA